ncbi:VOC family protein [Leptolyngbya sp. FACHB-671]|uniref:VOC family protein n=1 Tax=unclassified Leptolyngbya TaxID=2650499 RepID=UPI0016820CD0|nr:MULTISPECIES: VOC family protein [unclassified Leptolyngbya]MBD1870094.1 VOC family protein [Cyanobacteria bacterium FACHB-471]MBD1998422.1 VOC family protein [Leptolyngbya sp. FACHB-541]MBD2071145.1 VOC family protein [Leptolyngbya sp. FACHB-671]
MTIRPFHLAFPVKDLEATRTFYEQVLGCTIGRTSDKWIDFNLFGHQVTAHLSPGEVRDAQANQVDNKNVPVRHWGVILEMEQWKELAERLKQQNIQFVIEPYVRFKGEVGEQATLFFLDPSGNALEFKAFQHDESIFAS